MKIDIRPLFAIPLMQVALEENDPIRNMFDQLYNEIKNSDTDSYPLRNKELGITTHYDGWQISIETISDDEVKRVWSANYQNNWKNDWWVNSRSNLFKDIEELCTEFMHINPLESKKYEECTWIMQDMWVTELQEGQTNALHNHEGSIFSGVYYHTVPKYIGGPETHPDGLICFVGNAMASNASQYISNQIEWVVPKEGLLLIFPSALPHIVYPFKGDENRITFAFNLTRTFRLPQKINQPIVSQRKHGSLW
tara:strand:+ start:1768 stop:2523 length:756 start_codon:yes stop_codon:yes gene_type:complete